MYTRLLPSHRDMELPHHLQLLSFNFPWLGHSSCCQQCLSIVVPG